MSTSRDSFVSTQETSCWSAIFVAYNAYLLLRVLERIMEYFCIDPPDDPYADLSEEEYEEMLEAREIAESAYWDRRIDEARGN